MCSETVGVARVSWWMTAQSSSLSKMLRGSPGPGKRAKRVPPVPTPHDGMATANAATFRVISSMSILSRASLLAERRVVGVESARRLRVGRFDLSGVDRARGHARSSLHRFLPDTSA